MQALFQRTVALAGLRVNILSSPKLPVLTMPACSRDMSALKFLAAASAALWRERFYRPSDIARLQERRLRAILRHAVDNVPFYRAAYAGHDVATCALTDLPSVTKAQLMEHFDDTVAGGVVRLPQVVEFGRDKARVGSVLPPGLLLSMTSGTTGQVGYFLTERPTWERLRGTMLARLLRWRLTTPWETFRFGPWRRYRMGFLTATGGHYITYLLSLHAPAGAGLMMRQQAFSIMTPMQQMCGELDAFQPHYLHAYPTFVEALAHEQLAGRLHIAPEVLTLGSEPVTPSARAALQMAFPRADVFETYGTTECAVIAAQCGHGKMHINEDVMVLESVDAAGNPVPDGKLGTKVFITNLLTRVQPVIRYEVGDQVVISAPGCKCGSPLKTVQVLGRTDDTFYLKGEDGRFHAHTPIPFEVLFLDVEGLRQYQLVHERQDELRVYFTREPQANTAAIVRQLQEQFGRYFASNGLGATVQIAFEETDEIPRDPNTKKIRQIVSRVAPPANADELSGPWRLRGHRAGGD